MSIGNALTHRANAKLPPLKSIAAKSANTPQQTKSRSVANAAMLFAQSSYENNHCPTKYWTGLQGRPDSGLQHSRLEFGHSDFL
jgi:hypothetical protein